MHPVHTALQSFLFPTGVHDDRVGNNIDKCTRVALADHSYTHATSAKLTHKAPLLQSHFKKSFNLCFFFLSSPSLARHPPVLYFEVEDKCDEVICYCVTFGRIVSTAGRAARAGCAVAPCRGPSHLAHSSTDVRARSIPGRRAARWARQQHVQYTTRPEESIFTE